MCKTLALKLNNECRTTRLFLCGQCGGFGHWEERNLSCARYWSVQPVPFHSLVDDEGQSIGPKDFGQDTYQQLVELFSMPADWVLNQSIGSGELNK